jgi:hypothetical protein
MTVGLTPRLDTIVAGTQGFVDQSSLITVPYTAIVGRAQIPDITNDLRASLGIERIPIQQIQLLQNEQGPNGEPVYSVMNDDRGLIRFVGTITPLYPTAGSPIQIYAGSYCEITFYGTGLNALLYFGGVTRDLRPTVDGGTEGSTICPTSPANIIEERNYAGNLVINVASGLTLGLHTIKLRAVNNNYVLGFEIINSNASGLININPGTAYSKGAKYVNSVADSIAYNKDQAGATVVTGTKGGRIVRYINANNTIGTLWQAVDAAAAYGNSASHANEEVARVYMPREFGAGRYNATYANQDDFSLMSDTRAAAFTLDDGTTTLIASSGAITSITGQPEAIYPATNSNSITFTFIGCGLDLLLYDNTANTNGATVYQYQIDGGTATGWFYTSGSTALRVQKVVSGLSYGTHTFSFIRNTGMTFHPLVVAFKVYQPKKPSLPSGSIEICDYNVIGNYDASLVTGTAVANWNQIPQGTLAKPCTREMVYVGANWVLATVDAVYGAFGFTATTNANNNQTVSYTFFGTGAVVLLGCSSAGTYYFSVTIDSSLNSSGANLVNAALIGSGVYNCTSTTSGQPCRIAFTGLTLGVHTITVQRVTGGGAGNFVFNGLHIITPLHVHKYNLYGVLQNTLSVGSQGLADTRAVAPYSTPKAWAQAVGVTSTVTTSSTSFSPLPDMSVTIKTSGGALSIQFYAHMSTPATVGTYGVFSLYIDGVQVLSSVLYQTAAAYAVTGQVNLQGICPVSSGTHKVDIYYRAGGAYNIYANVDTIQGRTLTVREL